MQKMYMKTRHWSSRRKGGSKIFANSWLKLEHAQAIKTSIITVPRHILRVQKWNSNTMTMLLLCFVQFTHSSEASYHLSFFVISWQVNLVPDVVHIAFLALLFGCLFVYGYLCFVLMSSIIARQPKLCSSVLYFDIKAFLCFFAFPIPLNTPRSPGAFFVSSKRLFFMFEKQRRGVSLYNKTPHHLFALRNSFIFFPFVPLDRECSPQKQWKCLLLNGSPVFLLPPFPPN